jgi:transcription elongation factor Elf1
MSACPNCGTKLSCGCQKKKASNGTFVCRGCITKYERSLQEQKPHTQPTKVEPKLNVWGKDRYKNLHKFIK